MFVFFLILLGASFGGVLVVYPPLNSKTFGVKNSGINYGIMFFGYSVGSLLGPQIAARAANEAMGVAAYSNAYLVAIALAAAGLAINHQLMARQRKTAHALRESPQSKKLNKL